MLLSGVALPQEDADAQFALQDVPLARLASLEAVGIAEPVYQAPRSVVRADFTPANLLAWGMVRAGLLQTIAAIVLAGLCVLSLASATEPNMTVSLAAIGSVLAYMLCLAGMFLGVAVPGGTGAKVWAIGAVAALTAGMVFTIGQVAAAQENLTRANRATPNRPVTSRGPLPPQGNRKPDSPIDTRFLRYAAQVSIILATACYLVFVARLALFLSRKGLAVSAFTLLCVTCLTQLVLMFAGDGRGASSTSDITTGFILLLGGLLVLGVWSTYLLGSLYIAITRAATRKQLAADRVGVG